MAVLPSSELNWQLHPTLMPKTTRHRGSLRASLMLCSSSLFFFVVPETSRDFVCDNVSSLTAAVDAFRSFVFLCFNGFPGLHPGCTTGSDTVRMALCRSHLLFEHASSSAWVTSLYTGDSLFFEVASVASMSLLCPTSLLLSCVRTSGLFRALVCHWTGHEYHSL